MNTAFVLSPFRIVLLFSVATVIGFLCLPLLRTDLLPQPVSTQLSISYSLDNTSPDILEQQVTALLEGAFAQISQLKQISSASGYDHGRILLTFDEHADMQYKQFETAAMIRRLYANLPLHTTYPVITRQTDNDMETPFLVYNIIAPEQVYQLRKESEVLFRQALAEVKGIDNISVTGPGNLQVVIEYDPLRCLAWGIKPQAIENTLNSYAITTYPGSIQSKEGEQFFLRVKAPLQSIKEIENLILTNGKEQSIQLKQLAKVYIEEEEAHTFFRINGKNAVNLNITAMNGVNKLVLARQVKEIITHTALQLPKGYELRLENDETAYLRQEMNKNYRRIGLSMAILTLFILLTYRNWKHLLILISGLIVNLALTAMLALLFGVNIHLYSIAGLAVSFGLITDNTIVMLDYYRQFRHRKAVLVLLASTFTTIAALGLVFFLPEQEQQNLGDFALIIILALCASIMVALWFVPGMYHICFKEQDKGLTRNTRQRSRIYEQAITLTVHYRKTFLLLMLLLFGMPVFMLPEKWEGNTWYHHCYNKTLGSQVYNEQLRPYVDKWLGGAFRMFVKEVFEKSGYRNAEKTKLLVNASLPYGQTASRMNTLLSEIEEQLIRVKGIDKFLTNISSGQQGSIEISFKPGYDRSTLPYKLKAALIAGSQKKGGVEWDILGVGQGFTNMGGEEMPGFRVLMKGYNYDELERQAARLEQKLLQHQRIRKVNINERLAYGQKQSAAYVLETDAPKMALAGTNEAEVLEQLSALGKPSVSPKYMTLDHQFYPVLMKGSGAEDFSRYDMLYHPLFLDSGRQVRMNDLGSLEFRETANSIYREDRQYIRMVSFEYAGSAQFGNAYLEKVLEEMQHEMPAGYSAKQHSWNWSGPGAKRKYSLIFILIGINFLICSILFEDLRQPFHIILMVPVAFIGVFLIFSLGSFYFDQGGYAGFVMLGGLVVNAAIFIVNDWNNLRARHPDLEPQKLLVEAISNRARTIFLMVFSICCGLVPFLLEGQREVFWFSMAIGMIGGLLFSLFAVFVVLPTLLLKKVKK